MDSSTLPQWAFVRFGINGCTMITKTSDLNFVGAACKGASATIELDKVEHKVVIIKFAGSVAASGIHQREFRAIAEKQDAMNLNVITILGMMTKLNNKMDARLPKGGRTNVCTTRKSKKRKNLDWSHKSWFPQPLPELLSLAENPRTDIMTSEGHLDICPLVISTETTPEPDQIPEAEPTPVLGARQETEPTPEAVLSQPNTTLEPEHIYMLEPEPTQEPDIGPKADAESAPNLTQTTETTLEPKPAQTNTHTKY